MQLFTRVISWIPLRSAESLAAHPPVHRRSCQHAIDCAARYLSEYD